MQRNSVSEKVLISFYKAQRSVLLLTSMAQKPNNNVLAA